MNKQMNILIGIMLSFCVSALLYPVFVSADSGNSFAGVGAASIIILGLFIILGVVLVKIGTGVINASFLEHESLVSTKKRYPYIPSLRSVGGVGLVVFLLFLLSLKTIIGIAPFDGPYGWARAAAVFGIFGMVAMDAKIFWPKKSKQYVFASMIGTAITFILIGFQRSLFSGVGQDPFMVTLGIVSLVIAWRFLFGPWRPSIKAMVLGTFIFWVGVHIFFRESETERLAHVLAIMIALIPAIVWCMLFLGYHKQRISLVILMFFSGMLSTAPILLYDKIVRSGMELHFFLFKIVPESFTKSSNLFVSGQTLGFSGYKLTITASLVSFLIVGLIEELSKFWVLKNSGESFFKSIDDVIQLAIIVAIGFAFAENVLNPNYFLAFIREYLVNTGSPDWSGFLGNFLGRSILTTMVHIVSTGVLGYFFGLALFSKSYMKDRRKEGERLFVPRFLHRFLRLPEEEVFKREAIIFGLVIAITLHGIFNFLVTLPSILPGNPRTIGDLLGAPDQSIFHSVAILVIPSLIYVVGGFWLLSTLFYNKGCMKERKRNIESDIFMANKIHT